MREGPDAVLALFARTLAPVLERLAALEASRKKDSHNSGKPPSSDISRAGRAPKSLRASPGESGKRTGGQPGHPGRTLEMRAVPDERVIHAPEVCGTCGLTFPPDSPSTLVPGERRQVFDLPPMRLLVTEHQLHERCCPSCGTRSRGSYPREARSTVQYGPGVLALGVSLTAQHLMPVQRAADVVSGLTGQRVSPATLIAAEQRVGATVQPVVAHIHQGLARSPNVGFDETGFFVAGKRHWLHVACTRSLAYYTAHPKRGTKAHAAIALLPTYGGTALHDGYASYFKHEGCRHALCGVHLLRELLFLSEEGAEVTRPWAAKFRRFLETMRRATVRARAAGQSALDERTRRRYRRRYDVLLTLGEAAEPPPEPARGPEGRKGGRRGRRRRTPGAQLLYRLRRDRDAVMRFVDDLTVPFDNSEAERDLRMMKVEQKVSGSFRTPGGAHTFCTLRSYLVTARKQGLAALEALRNALLGQPFMPAVP